MPGKGIPVVAFLSEISERLTKSGKRMAYIPLEDETGSYRAVMFEMKCQMSGLIPLRLL